MATPDDILRRLADTLRDAGLFARVSLGTDADANDVPRAAVLYDGTEELPCDDDPAARWVRLRARVTIVTRLDGDADAAARLAHLADAAAAALLEDPRRGGLCADLPIGRATEVGRADAVEVRRPNAETHLTVRCCFEIAGGA